MAGEKPYEAAFGTLTPINLHARMAFSDLYDRLIAGRQNVEDKERVFRIGRDPQLVLAPDSEAFKRHMRRRAAGKADADADQISDTLPDTQSESDAQRHPNDSEPGWIWQGHFILSFIPEPSNSTFGWTVGKRRPLGLERTSGQRADILVCTSAFEEENELSVRHFHARFTFSQQTGQLGIARNSSNPAWPVTASGIPVEKRLHILNAHTVPISFGALQYEFRYTEFARTPEYFLLRNEYMARAPGGGGFVELPEIPTPRPHQRQFGSWVMGRPLGKDSEGRVFEGTNTKDEVAALQILRISNSRERTKVNQQISTTRALTCLANTSGGGDGILRLVEVIGGPNDDEMVLVHKPVAKLTLDAFIANHHSGGPHGMSNDGATALRELLLAVKFMHDHRFIHGDLRPGNVGIDLAPIRVTLLGVGTASRLERPGDLLPPAPGSRGSVHYLAPECELKQHGSAIDMWAVGVMAYQLTYGQNPFRFRVNPWRETRASEKLRPEFIRKYEDAISRMEADYRDTLRSPREGYLHLGSLIRKMLRFPELDLGHGLTNTGVRITVDEALSDPDWGEEFLTASSGPDARRVRRE
ncbi:kinase-like domain-containing protein [Chaetomium sp. MPI-SDFR-AT-0129]|nr:kinase-like domain-containing protein [Chaetomium sp. MPI-SDFR-AT-0129]